MAQDDSVLVVNSSPAELRWVGECLSPTGVLVRAASGLLEAVLELATAPAPVILYDYDAETRQHWPQALPHLLQLRPDARVIVVTGLANAHIWMDIVEAGGFDVLARPFLPEELRCIVRTAQAGLRSRPHRLCG